MSRSNWGLIFALFGFLTLSQADQLQSATGGGPKVEANTNRGAEQEQNRTANSVTNGNVVDRKKAVEADCGTPKECRAEQREKDDLVAQQAAANAALGQRNAAWWQTGVGAAGVMLLILTVIYTHLATRAAINSVKTLVAVERARIAIMENETVNTLDGKKAKFRMLLSNDGRSAGVLRETSITCSKTGLFKDFQPKNIKKHNNLIPMKTPGLLDTLEFDLNDENKFIVGYYKFSTIFSNKLITDYFCFEIGDAAKAVASARRSERAAAAAAEAEQAAKAAAEGKSPAPRKRIKKVGAPLASPVVVTAVYRTDLDWPPDED